MKEKSVLGLLIGLASYITGRITMVTIVFFIFMTLDFITGVFGSKSDGEKYDPSKAKEGVRKKLGYLIFWFMGVLVELVIVEQGAALGIVMNIPIISLAVTFWLLGTEGLSILYNLDKMGVKGIPKWFTTYFEKMKAVNNQDSSDEQ